MAKLDPARNADAWDAFRRSSDEHIEQRHEATMKRKRDDLKFELHAKRQRVLLSTSLVDDTLRIAAAKCTAEEKQLEVDRRRYAFTKLVHNDNLAHKKREAEQAQLALDNLNALYLEREKTQDEVKLLLTDARALLDKREALLNEKEDILRQSKYVCSLCLDSSDASPLHALDPCGHCFCATCVSACGVVLGDPDDAGTRTYVGACPSCRTDVADVLRIFL